MEQNNTAVEQVTPKEPEKKELMTLGVRRAISYIVLVLLTVVCLFSFYMLLINATRAHSDIQKGFSLLPGKSFMNNLNNVLNNDTILIVNDCVYLFSSPFSIFFSYDSIRTSCI